MKTIFTVLLTFGLIGLPSVSFGDPDDRDPFLSRSTVNDFAGKMTEQYFPNWRSSSGGSGFPSGGRGGAGILLGDLTGATEILEELGHTNFEVKILDEDYLISFPRGSVKLDSIFQALDDDGIDCELIGGNERDEELGRTSLSDTYQERRKSYEGDARGQQGHWFFNEVQDRIQDFTSRDRDRDRDREDVEDDR